MIDFIQLEQSGIDFSQVFFACRAFDKKRGIKQPIQSLDSIYQWRNRGIPRRFLGLVSGLVSKHLLRTADKAAIVSARAPQADLFSETEKHNEIINLDNNLSGFSDSLVTVAFSQSTEFFAYWVRCYFDSFIIAETALTGSKMIPYWDSAAAKMPFTAQQQQEIFITRSRKPDFAIIDFTYLDFIDPRIQFTSQLFAFYAMASMLSSALCKEYRKNDRFKSYFSKLKHFEPPKVEEKDLPDFLVQYRYSLHETARRLLPMSRISACTHIPLGKDSLDFPTAAASDQSGVILKYHPEFSSTSFSGLQTCGSPWSCPICAPKISRFRGNELSQAIDFHTLESKAFRKEQGKKFKFANYVLRDFGVSSFVTRTIPHSASDSLEYVLDTFQAADAKLKQHRQYKKLMDEYGVIGSVKVFELTIGKNGWHLHVHEIYFHDSEKRCMLASGQATGGGQSWYETLRFQMWSVWRKAAVSAGFDAPSFAHGLQVQNGDFAAEYAAKFGQEPSEGFWTSDRELSGYHLKKSFSGLSPFDLLRQYHATQDMMYSDLFIEYSSVMKGARQMMWSRGLKDYFGITDKTDEDVASQDEDVAAFALGEFTKQEWRVVCVYSLKAYVLLMAKYEGFSAVQAFLKSLPPPHN